MKVNLHEPSFGEEEIMAACDQMRTTHVTMGKQVRSFENQCAEYFGSKYALMCNSGSSANLLAIAALCNPLFKGQYDYIGSTHYGAAEVIVPALSWATSVWPIIQHGKAPVFVDCDPKTYNMDPEKIERAITKATRAIMVVHVYGNPCDMNAIMDIAKRHNLYVIEDTCESMGAKLGGKCVGTFGDIGTMSLYYSHHITTFEGGLCFTDNFELIEMMRVLRAHGWSREADEHEKYVAQYPDIDPRFIFINLGYNLRPTEVQAVIGMKQLPKLDGFIKTRVDSYNRYRAGLEKYSDLFSFQEKQPGSEPSWFGFGITLTDKCTFTLKEITGFLQSRGVETRPIIAGNMYRHPALLTFAASMSRDALPNCDRIMQRGFAIGCHHAITEEAQAYVIEQFDAFMS